MDLFAEDGNLNAYLKLSEETEAIEVDEEAEPREYKTARIKKLAFRMFINKLGRKNFEKWIAGKLTAEECLKIANFKHTRRQWAEMLGNEYGYAKWNKDGLSDHFNTRLNKYFKQSGRPIRISLTLFAVKEFLDKMKEIEESKKEIAKTTTS